MLRTLAFCLCVALALTAPHPVPAAEDSRVITWDDLIPKMEELENPFSDLKPEVLDRVSYVARAREDLALGFLKEDSPEYQDALKIERELLDEGVDVKGLLAAAERLMAEVERRSAIVNADLNGQIVRMPGYALPLEQSEAGVTEFLLVPYVGACIHVPPPPPNQIVYVKLAEPFKVNNLFEPVWITGKMVTEAASRDLSLVDGSAAVETGYRMDGMLIEPYQ